MQPRRMTSRSRITIVLGVHRSGTSLLTRALIGMGSQAGAFGDIFDADNPDGYAEHPSVRKFNARLLEHLGASWDNWGFQASVVDWDSSELVAWHDEAVKLLQQVFDGSGPFVLKDPRVATLAPFWERVVPLAGFEMRRLIILRDPAEVAESQMQRVARRPYEFPVIAALEPMAALWSVTMFEVLSALRDDATMLVSHAQLIAEPACVLATIAPFAGLSANEDMVAELALQGVKPELHRARVVEVSNGRWMEVARAFFDDFDPSLCPRPLLQAEAVEILRRQTKLTPMLAGLSAVRDSIRRMNENNVQRQHIVTDISRIAWMLAPLTPFAPKEVLSNVIEQAELLARETSIERTSLVFGHTLTRLYIQAGRLDEAALYLDHIRPYFGHIHVFHKLEQELAASR